MEESQFDMEGLKKAFEAGDVDGVLEFYAEDLDHIEVDEGAPPRSPRRTGADYIRSAVAGDLRPAGREDRSPTRRPGHGSGGLAPEAAVHEPDPTPVTPQERLFTQSSGPGSPVFVRWNLRPR